MFWNTKKQDIEDKITTKALTDFSEDLNNPLRLIKTLKLFLILNILIWLVVLILPNYVAKLAPILGRNKLSAIVLGIPFGAAFYLAYTIIRYKIPNVEENKTLDSDLMGSMDYQTSANRRYYVWMGAILCGIFNVILLGAVCYALELNGLYFF